MDKDNFLQFIGNGSAFNNRLGNTSAFIKNETNKELILIDCGGDVFHKLVKSNILKKVSKINVVLTHLHPDHVGSLGDLIFYNYYTKDKITNVYYPKEDIVNLLNLMDVDGSFYNLIKDDKFTINNYNFTRIAQVHRSQQDAYGYFIRDNKSKVNVLYSGDSKTIPDNVLTWLNEDKLDILYQDVSTYDFEGNPHLSMDELLNLIPDELRHKVICMHLDNHFNKNRAEFEGFKVSNNIFQINY